MALVISITDPDTVVLLERYRQYVDQVDGEKGTLDQLAEGLMLGMLDEHNRFREWSRQIMEVAA
ncbi:hypothetical protein QLQ15_11095 [Lysobacter sp. LF1]|uniref:Uncharacterized protein n=1 Tax=Lysobacter stagni TaxID=3045172 RepID=A0ABT6XHA4_9GAMM|nr:hypothetical protein [Lysobacter sp. LF1]MDI9239449.1 hypothetical protein [Lysobacter sp. LF1]